MMRNELIQILKEEKCYQFESFSNLDAWKLGNILVETALKEELAIAIMIERSGQRLFQYSCFGTTKNNDNWLEAKSRIVNYFGCSSLYTETRLKIENVSLENDSKICSKRYFAKGGAFPIAIKNTGVIGSIIVSGLTPKQDHEFVIKALKKFSINREK